MMKMFCLNEAIYQLAMVKNAWYDYVLRKENHHTSRTLVI